MNVEIVLKALGITATPSNGFSGIVLKPRLPFYAFERFYRAEVRFGPFKSLPIILGLPIICIEAWLNMILNFRPAHNLNLLHNFQQERLPIPQNTSLHKQIISERKLKQHKKLY